MSIILWIVFGALIGWLASLIFGNEQQGVGTDIVSGIIGALLGGGLMVLLGVTTDVSNFDWGSFIVSLIGAIVLVAIVRGVRGGAEAQIPREHYR